MEGPHWKEALKVLKLVVSRSSTLVAPPLTSHHHTHWEPSPHLSFTDVELFTKKELPGNEYSYLHHHQNFVCETYYILVKMI